MAFQQSDVDLLKSTVGGDFDYTPASNALFDAVPSAEPAVKAPDLSALKRQRLGSRAASIASDASDSSLDDVFSRFTKDKDQIEEPSVPEEPSFNRVYLKKSRDQSDATEEFAPKPVVISGKTGLVTERG
jgi:hypothetical protein